MNTLRSIATIAAAALLLAGVLSAQAPTAGRITGTVLDDQGAPLPGVSVEAKSPRLVGSAATVTDTNGVYRLLALPPGTYQIIFTLSGFNPVVRDDIVLGVEQALAVDIALTPSAISEEVVVIGESPLIDVKSSARGSVMNAKTFSALPKGRSFDSLVTIMPGVQAEKDLLDGISVDGASGAENVFYVDGTDTSDLVKGTRKQEVVFEFAEEVQFKASGYNAEYGGSVGGVVNVITRTGGNAFHGEFLGYFSGTALEGQRRDRLYLDLADDTQARYYPYEEYVGVDKETMFEGGFSLGGYILKDRLWFFGALAPRLFQRERAMDMAIQGLTGVNTYTRKETSWNSSFKLSAQPLKNLRAGASFAVNFFKYQGGGDPDGGDATYAINSNASTDYGAPGYSYPTYSGSAYADLTLGNRALLSVRGGYFFTNKNHSLTPVSATPFYAFELEQPGAYADVTNTMFPEIPEEYQHPAGWRSFNRSLVMGLEKRIGTRFSLGGDFTYYLDLGGEHAFKAGVQFVRRGEDVNDGAMQPIVYLGWDQDCLGYGENYGRGAYGYYAVRGNSDAGPYGEGYDVAMNSWSLYLQDSWTIARRLTLNLGIRAESEYLPSYNADVSYPKPVNFTFADKLAPRLGFVYDVFGDSSFKVFGSFGIFHDVMKLNMGANALGGLKWKSAYYTLDDWDYTQIGVDGYFPGTLIWVNDFRAPIFDAIDPDMKPFTQREISFGAEKKLMEDMALSVRLVNKKVLSAIEDIGFVFPGEEYFYFSNPGSDFIKQKFEEFIASGNLLPGTPSTPKAKRDYYAMNLSLEKRFSHNWQGGLSYTLSRLVGNYSGLASADEDGRNSPNGERYFDLWHLGYDKQLNPIDGVLPTDRTHVFKAYGSYAFPFGLTVGLVTNAYSGTPVSEQWNVDSECYFPFNRGNMGRTPFIFFANAYLEYELKLGRAGLRFNLNIDNLFDARTAQRVYDLKYRYNLSPGDAALLSKDWIVAEDEPLDPRFGMAYSFMAPISGRLGVRFVF